MPKRNLKTDDGYLRIKDSKMRWQGDIDDEKKIIRVNPAKSKKKSSLIDTITHEEMHRDHPQMHEKTVYKKTKESLEKMSNMQKQKKYKLYA